MQTTPTTVPTRAEVDAAFLTSTLRAAGVLRPDAEVVAVDADRLGVGVGIVCDLWRLHPVYAGEGTGTAPRTLVLKLPAADASTRALFGEFGCYQREARFYADLAGEIGVRTPRCYWSAVDEPAECSALLLEDLDGWAPGCQVAGATPVQAQHAMDALAAVHAPAWERPPAAAWLERLGTGVFATYGIAYRETWPAFVDRYAHLLPAGAEELGRRLGDSYEDLQAAAIAEAPTTMCHGDPRLDNLLFRNGSTAVLDWQLVHLGPAVYDLALFLTQSLTVDLRRRCEQDLLRRWHTAMVRALGPAMDAYPLELTYAHYRRMALHMTCDPVILGGGMEATNERGAALLETIGVRAFTAALDLDTQEFLSP